MNLRSLVMFLWRRHSVKFTIIRRIWKLLGRGLWHPRPGQHPIHAGGGGHVGGWAEGLGLLLLLLHHHGHSLLPEVVTEQLSAALGDHLGIKETLLIPQRRT